ncbi:MAG: endonuclease/exonuclease/phosphatase family protein, partial [Eudoraea sp.]|nr:endonuclease/exonuclease/phosphatase family protein [Eudoraea sp.]
MQKLVFLFLFLIFQLANSQEKEYYRVRTIAFYNVENLFDITNDTLIYDDERTPSGRYQWTAKRYKKKIADIATVLTEIGQKERLAPPDVIGLCEVENLEVLKDLVNHLPHADAGYGIVHYDSPDERGIDVALLYKKNSFLPISMKKHRLIILNSDRQRDYTRDQLVVSGLLRSELIYLIVNHWPSRSGGELKSRGHRIKAAELNRYI